MPGVPQYQFALNMSIGLTNWATGPTLELIYGSVTLLFITPTAINDPPAQCSRGTGVP